MKTKVHIFVEQGVVTAVWTDSMKKGKKNSLDVNVFDLDGDYRHQYRKRQEGLETKAGWTQVYP